jgi:hypothetical protein
MSENNNSKKWDACIENSLVKTGYGLVGAGIASFLLFRSPLSRTGVTMFGAGVGAGISWMECRLSFENANPQLSTFTMPDFSKWQQ